MANDYHKAVTEVSPKLAQQVAWAAIRLTRTHEADTQGRDAIIDELMECMYKIYELGYVEGREAHPDERAGI